MLNIRKFPKSIAGHMQPVGRVFETPGLHSLADQNVHRLEKMFSTQYHAKAT